MDSSQDRFAKEHAMKTVPLHHPHDSGSPGNNAFETGLMARLRSGRTRFAHALRRLDETCAAIGLAEGGDVAGAAELVEQARRAHT